MSAQRDGFKPDELLAAGLARRGRGGGVYDWFRGRITFPLADPRGRVLGFGARAMREDQGAKYVNTPEGELYHKGRLLFGIDRARSAIAKSGRVVVVEGYTDVLALHQAGVEDSVAIMGTALTGDQLDGLARAAGDEGTVFLALDADRAGRDAMLRAARMAEERGVGLRVVQMPEGTDPAELVTEGGAEAIVARVTSALSVVEFEVERVLADADRDTPEGRDRALAEARDVIAATPGAAPAGIISRGRSLIASIWLRISSPPVADPAGPGQSPPSRRSPRLRLRDLRGPVQARPGRLRWARSESSSPSAWPPGPSGASISRGSSPSTSPRASPAEPATTWPSTSTTRLVAFPAATLSSTRWSPASLSRQTTTRRRATSRCG